MILRKIDWINLNDILEGRKLVIFGAGSNFKYCIEHALTESNKNNIAYAIDNNAEKKDVYIKGKQIDVYTVNKLKEETDCTVLIGSNDYMYEMYMQLNEMGLPDTVECIGVPLLLAEYCGSEGLDVKASVFDITRKERIPKVIHTFWFSGDEIPKDYQECLDSWKRICPDYEIKIWDTHTYKTDHPAVLKPLSDCKWASASDYARLDILNKYGGIYMDMDVKIEKSLDSLLGNRAFFTFESGNEIEPAIMGSEQGYCLLGNMMEAYEDIEFDGSEESLKEWCMPHLVRKPIENFGIKMDGNLQYIDGAAFLPRKYFCPMDNILYEMSAYTDETIGVHLMNGSWKAKGFKEKKRIGNRKFRDIVHEKGI